MTAASIGLQRVDQPPGVADRKDRIDLRHGIAGGDTVGKAELSAALLRVPIGDRLTSLCGSLLALSRIEPVQPDLIAISEVVGDVNAADNGAADKGFAETGRVGDLLVRGAGKLGELIPIGERGHKTLHFRFTAGGDIAIGAERDVVACPLLIGGRLAAVVAGVAVFKALAAAGAGEGDSGLCHDMISFQFVIRFLISPWVTFWLYYTTQCVACQEGGRKNMHKNKILICA
nr:MAG TPA: hypothetical protein [Caudoviricetes sp.]